MNYRLKSGVYQDLDFWVDKCKQKLMQMYAGKKEFKPGDRVEVFYNSVRKWKPGFIRYEISGSEVGRLFSIELENLHDRIWQEYVLVPTSDVRHAP